MEPPKKNARRAHPLALVKIQSAVLSTGFWLLGFFLTASERRTRCRVGNALVTVESRTDMGRRRERNHRIRHRQLG